MDKSARIYIAGHRGLVGSAILRRLTADGFQNVLVRTHKELDLTDQAAVRDFYAETKPEYVVLGAAKVGGIFANNAYPAEFIHANLAIETNAIHEAWRAGVKRLLFLGSSCIYPRDCPQPMKEEHLLTGPLEATNRPYAVAKIAGIEMCWAYNRQYGTSYLAAMPTNLYGPRDNYDLMQSHVLPALIRKFHLAKLAAAGDTAGLARDRQNHGAIPEDFAQELGVAFDGDAARISHSHPRVKLWGSGSPKREFLFVDDLAEACVFLMQMPDAQFGSFLSNDRPPLVNIGCGEDQTIRELAETVRRVVGFEGEVVWDATKPDGTPRKLLNIDVARGLGWAPRTSLDTGIASAYADYLSR